MKSFIPLSFVLIFTLALVSSLNGFKSVSVASLTHSIDSSCKDVCGLNSTAYNNSAKIKLTRKLAGFKAI